MTARAGELEYARHLRQVARLILQRRGAGGRDLTQDIGDPLDNAG